MAPDDVVFLSSLMNSESQLKTVLTFEATEVAIIKLKCDQLPSADTTLA